MSLKKKPVTGMKDISPREMEIRDYVIGLIKETYKQFGFSSMETPCVEHIENLSRCVEHIENLSSKQGGENEKLIFKILKRGEKLKMDTAQCEMDLVDGGLRYDLTVPLSRYYANNANDLPAPFKALQMGNVWRADRPQRGRYRQFMQCDIDILGEPTILAEIELILATSTLVGKLDFENFTIRINDGRYRQFMQCDIDILGEPTILAEIELILATSTLVGKLDFENFTIRINDRKILKAMAAYSGFAPESYDTVFIILDKMDKIGIDGVAEELKKEGFAAEAVEKYIGLFEQVTGDVAGIRYLKETLNGVLEPKTAEELETIIESVETVKTANFQIVFDPTLVRGMSYYTGPIFEISIDGFGGSVGGGGRYDEMTVKTANFQIVFDPTLVRGMSYYTGPIFEISIDGFGGSVGGGGRYDEMIGRFTGNPTPACGFSIGFERIVMLLLEKDYQIPGQKEKTAFLIEKGMPKEKLLEVFKQATEKRAEGACVSMNMMKKNKKFQKEQLTAEGYTEIVEFFAK